MPPHTAGPNSSHAGHTGRGVTHYFSSIPRALNHTECVWDIQPVGKHKLSVVPYPYFDSRCLHSLWKWKLLYARAALINANLPSSSGLNCFVSHREQQLLCCSPQTDPSLQLKTKANSLIKQSIVLSQLVPLHFYSMWQPPLALKGSSLNECYCNTSVDLSCADSDRKNALHTWNQRWPSNLQLRGRLLIPNCLPQPCSSTQWESAQGQLGTTVKARTVRASQADLHCGNNKQWRMRNTPQLWPHFLWEMQETKTSISMYLKSNSLHVWTRRMKRKQRSKQYTHPVFGQRCAFIRSKEQCCIAGRSFVRWSLTTLHWNLRAGPPHVDFHCLYLNPQPCHNTTREMKATKPHLLQYIF